MSDRAVLNLNRTTNIPIPVDLTSIMDRQEQWQSVMGGSPS